ncbi:MAG TPA: CvpA family protein [Candidatus Nanoarchaeia archaeon]
MYNFVDLAILFLIIYLIWQGLRTGLVGGILNVITTVTSFILATGYYSQAGGFLSDKFNLNENLGLVAGFFLIIIFGEIVLSLMFTYLHRRIAGLYKKSKLVATFDKYLGIIPSVLVGLFLVSLLMLLILTLPVKPWLREPIQNSWWGQNVVVKGTNFVPTIEEWLGKVPYKNLVYIVTPASPNSKDIQELNIPSTVQIKPDPESEKEMLDLVNKERIRVGLQPVLFNNPLRDVGRAHCEDMFRRSYFSHYTPEGKDPFQRMDEAKIDYVSAGENLAYAPSVSIAHEGLMNSPGHRENILRESFGKLGAGVIDAGVNGKMFCQEFTN